MGLDELSGQIEGFTACAKLGVESNEPTGGANRSAFDFLFLSSAERVTQPNLALNGEPKGSAQTIVTDISARQRSFYECSHHPYGAYLKSDISPYYFVAMESDAIQHHMLSSDHGINDKYALDSRTQSDSSVHNQECEQKKWSSYTTRSPIPLGEFALPSLNANTPLISSVPTKVTKMWPIVDMKGLEEGQTR